MSLPYNTLLAVAQVPGKLPVVEPLQPLPPGTTPTYKDNLRSGDFASPAGDSGGNSAQGDISTALPGEPSAAQIATPAAALATTRAVTPGWGIWAWIVVLIIALTAVVVLWKRSFKK
jgi:hypothetical protein